MADRVDEWRAVIGGAASRRDARDALGCTFAELKAFRAAHMPEHKWPNTKTPEAVATEKYMQRVKKREAAGAGPDSRAIDDAIAQLTDQWRQVMTEFVPGTRNRELATEYNELAKLGLIQAILRFRGMSAWTDGFGYTDLGRAVQQRLKEQRR